ncbi:MAG: 5'-methylthioadenosine/adenosylhomocysteine nucleosidase, partial [Clostridiales bacterium]|nr:5'-methylthioadenosine/adenosylhomocysteine nucleosidase [Clostridiales bacterium]
INVKNKIKNEFGASACEMAGGAIGQTCFMAKTPICVLRAISDGGDDAAAMEYPLFAAAAADRSIKVIMKFLENDN